MLIVIVPVRVMAVSTGGKTAPACATDPWDTTSVLCSGTTLPLCSHTQGGDVEDDVQWAEDVAGVTREWCAEWIRRQHGRLVHHVGQRRAAHNGFPQGTDGVSRNDKGPDGTPRGTVATGDELVVAHSIVTKQPVTALVYYCAPIANNLTITLSGLTAATTATRAAIAAAIADVLFRNGDPRAGTINRDDISAAIRSVASTSGCLITLIQGVVGATTTTYAGNITSGFGQLPVLANVLYV
ncbi:baseplate J/gp47 family protein [Paraburkholderia caledonica]|uniref:baseplate J/gp47 family protein n=1 Tax=Paraburkholderia caledonica TaxID=134536 RepID=UPI0038B73ADE